MTTGPISNEDLKDMRDRCELTSEGPWYSYIEKSVMSQPDQTVVAHCPDLQQQPAADNAAFIANARQDMPRLLDAIKEYKEALEDLLEAGQDLADTAKLGSRFQQDIRVMRVNELLGRD